MRAGLRTLVRSRAGNRCEYCLLHEIDLPLYRFHIEHIVARKHGGKHDADNLCWSCLHCNLSKSSNLTGRDPLTRRVVLLFNPRRERWDRNFLWDGPVLLGRTARGRATIDVLNINAPHRVELRRLLIQAGIFPPA